VIPWAKKFWHDLWFDAAFGARVTRALLMGYALSAVGLGAMLTGKPLWVRLAIFISAGISGAIGGVIAAGQMNPTDKATVAAVDRNLATVGERKVVEPGPVIPASADPASNPPASPVAP
jgi:hypothetical protein